MLHDYNEKRTEITTEKIVLANKALDENDASEFFNIFFDNVTILQTCSGEEEIELEHYTKYGVDMITYIDSEEWREEFRNYVESFDVDGEIMLHREGKRYCDDFSLSESVDDMYDWKHYLDSIVSIMDGDYADNIKPLAICFLKDKWDEKQLNSLTFDEKCELADRHVESACKFATYREMESVVNSSIVELRNCYLYFVNTNK